MVHPLQSDAVLTGAGGGGRVGVGSPVARLQAIKDRTNSVVHLHHSDAVLTGTGGGRRVGVGSPVARLAGAELRARALRPAVVRTRPTQLRPGGPLVGGRRTHCRADGVTGHRSESVGHKSHPTTRRRWPEVILLANTK